MTLKQVSEKYKAIVDEYSDERDRGDGIWFYLRPGFINALSDTHCVHEYTIRDCVLKLKDDVRPCDCEWCRRLLDERAKKAR